MFVRLTRQMRIKAGWFVALLYLFCVAAPGIALALGDAAPCLPAESAPVAVAHMHGDSAHQHDGMHAAHISDTGHAAHMHDGKTSNGKTSNGKTSHDNTSHGPCCAMLCLSAIPADLPAIANPSQPTSVALSEIERRLPGKAPARLYRPPIA